ncbi:sugar-binding transcriptional regulator [Numidum massiliense]|uniref:sugar-binding transcriptional regulator n=1 Tax=Numidum massiliense TaxID=1522315 RepID=UPI0006D52D6D|nr:sugar-binding domain-containing protein [Numidum massiliense]
MEQLLAMQKQLLPDLLDVMHTRYNVLHHIRLMQPIGRRNLAAAMPMTERVLRREVDFLKSQQLIQTASIGMRLTSEGEELLEGMEPLIKRLFGLGEIEEEVAAAYGLTDVVIVPGDSDESPVVKKALGRAGAHMLASKARKGDVIAVNGGTTVATVAEMLTATSTLKETVFVPARGGLGEAVELQASYLASSMAKKTGASYKLMHIPEQMSEETYHSLMNEPHTQEVLQLLHRARIVVHGIGDALAMARRRKVSRQRIEKLLAGHAVGEAFGYYFDRWGKLVYRMQTTGLQLEDVRQADIVIAVAGGKSKAAAIASVCRGGNGDILVTDEAAARQMIHLYKSEPHLGG